MPQQLPVFRAARLVGVSRSTLQKRIRQEGIDTFEGTISISKLLMLYPQTELGHDNEYERVQNIKAHAFAKRVRERVLPDTETLVSRITELGQELASTRVHLSQHQTFIEQIANRLLSIENQAPQTETLKEIQKLSDWVKSILVEPTKPTLPTQDLLTHNTVLSIMSAHVKIQPSNHEFWLEGNDNLLEAGVRSGLSLNYGCTNGNCGLCKARIVSGEVKKIQNHDYVFSEAEKNMDYILLCSCTAVSDVVLEALEAKDENDIPKQEIITKVKKLESLNDTVIMLHLQTPRMQRLRFLAGQSVTLSFPNGESIELPIASCPCDDRNLLFHINQHNETTITEGLSKGDQVTVTGPVGHFLLKEESSRTQIHIAFGTGFAPIKSLIEHAMAVDENADMHLYRVANKKEDLYLHNLCRSWDDALEDFHYHPIIDTDLTKTLTANHTNLNDCDIYIAGMRVQTIEVRENLLGKGLLEEQLIVNHIG